MGRLSIDVTNEQHKRLKALAALEGKSIKEFVLDSTLGAQGSDAERALGDLEKILRDRLRDAKGGGISERTVSEIFQDEREPNSPET